MTTRKNKLFFLKIISLFSVVRGYNIPIIILAQYLSAIFILSPEKRALEVILDFNLFIIVLSSSITIASGYIINNFYDSKKDIINRPNKSMLDRFVSQKTKLSVYFILNFIATILLFFVSWRAVKITLGDAGIAGLVTDGYEVITLVPANVTHCNVSFCPAVN